MFLFFGYFLPFYAIEVKHLVYQEESKTLIEGV